MQKEKKEKHFLQKPTYPGGAKAMGVFLTQQMKYPAEALAHKISGLVQVELTISHTGEVVDTRIIHGLGHGCDEEARRVARLLRFHVPKNRGIKVRFFKKINIQFNLPKVPEATVNPTSSMQVNISYKPEVKSTTSDKQQSGKSATITYSINLGRNR
jgi:TonB family protein